MGVGGCVGVIVNEAAGLITTPDPTQSGTHTTTNDIHTHSFLLNSYLHFINSFFFHPPQIYLVRPSQLFVFSFLCIYILGT